MTTLGNSALRSTLTMFFGALLVAWSVSLTATAARPKTVRVESTPPGAVVLLDVPDAVPLGATPLRRVKVLPGEQTFIFRLDGYEELRLPVTVKRHGQKITATLLKAAVLDITAIDQATWGAALSIDGVPTDRVPKRVQVSPGRHLIEIKGEGRAPTEQWVTVERGQVLAVPVQVGGDAAGGLLVTSDVPGAEVWVDGQRRGVAPLVWEDAPTGKRSIEVRVPGRSAFRSTAEVAPGRRTTVAASLNGARGGLRVSTDAPGAEVWIDGERLGPAPAGRDDLSPGEHMLEVSASGFDPLSETVVVEGGHRRLLVVRLEPLSGDPIGAVIVDAEPKEATVKVDGRDYGGAPAYVRGLVAGEREVVIAAPGHHRVVTRCRVGPKKDCRVKAALVPGGERLVVRSSVDGGALYLGETLLGPLPYDGGIAPGKHLLVARADGHTTWSTEIDVRQGSDAGVFDAKLERVRPEVRGTFVHSADVLPPKKMAIDLSVGWVHLAELSFDIGILSFLDAGFALRGFGRLTELEAHARGAWRFTPLLSAGVRVRAGGGFGPRDVDTGFFLAELLGSVHIEPRVAITILFASDIYSDEYPYSETDSDVAAASDGRQTTVGFRFGGNVEVALTERWNLWAGIEWTAGRSESRRVLGDLFGSGSEAANLWFRLGASASF
ncbi:MAG: PEGA domain-containing protein [Myxococcales bacterium]|nr:PEGA domain-containing protein [Myxococcales bacterium]